MDFLQTCIDIYHCDTLKNWLDYGDLDLSFMVTGGLRCQILVLTISFEQVDGFSSNLPGYIIVLSLRSDLVTLPSFSRPQEDLDDQFLYQQYLWTSG